MQINDPNGQAARVTADGHIEVSGRTETLSNAELLSGNAYNLNTGDVTISTSNESGVLYMKNTGNKDWIVSFVIILGTSTGGTGDVDLKIYRNPTAGTLIDSGTAITFSKQYNRNFGSTNSLTGTFKKGTGAALTITASDGVHIQSILAAPGRTSFDAIPIELNPDASVAVTLQIGGSNTDWDVQVAAVMHERNLEI